MNRAILTAAVLLLLAPAATAQDMPLSQILIDGEGWKKAEGKAEKPKLVDTKPALKIGSLAYSPDRQTVYVWALGNRFIWAHRATPDGKWTEPGGPYCPLRIREGLRRKKAEDLEFLVTALTVDKDGRIYAATPLGIQVFDPTGRLCGVITAPPGKVDHLEFEGDRLTAWVGDTKYARKLKTTGVK